MTHTDTIDFSGLARRISGDVHSDLLRRLLLATDGSIFQQLPACVVYPKSVQDVAQTLRFAGRAGISVHARGAGSGLTGAAIGRGIVLDFTRYMNRLLCLDEEKKLFVCEPGYRFGELEARLRGTGLFFPPDPSSGEYATFGGMFGTNASGAHSVKYGNVADYVQDADIMTADGEVLSLSEIRETDVEDLPERLQHIFRMYEAHADDIESAYPPVRCNVAGYNLRGLVRDGRLCLDRLFVGAEGTLGIATRLTFRLLSRPAHDSLVVAYFEDPLSAARATQALLPMAPAGIEIMDKSLLRLAKESEPALRDHIPDGVDNAVLIEFDADDPELCTQLAKTAMRTIRENFTDQAYPAASAEEKEKFWAVRKAAVPILYKLKGRKKILALIEDAAVPTDRMVEYFSGIYRILGGLDVEFVLYGHIAKGLMHTRPLLDLKDPHDVGLLRTIADEVYELVASLDGTVSGEHGDGRLRSAYLRRRYPKIYDLFLETKNLLDPAGILNPEIITRHDPEQMMKHLRFGAGYRSEDRGGSQLVWQEDGFIPETEKCHGCSKCTTISAATRMCPVYKATREEAASPKAKANLLRALISGAVNEKTLYEKAFQQVMKLCANCGSCAFECPSNVDIPKLAMEARARYVTRFGAPMHDHLVTRVEAAGCSLRKVAPVLRAVRNLPGAAWAAERFSGVAREREVLNLSPRSLFERIGFREGKGAITVLYFAGCYAGYLQPQIGAAAVKVLTRMGLAVLTPPQHCCGLPAMTKGMARDARKRIFKNLEKWSGLLHRVDHVVVTCSSCGYALMKDWGCLVRDDRAAEVAKKTVHISHFLDRHWNRLDLYSRTEKIAYHHPCHLKIQPDPDSSLRMLSRIPGVQVDNLHAHCCGMIGSWGMAAENYLLSRRIGEDLIRKMESSDAPLAATDCPTCRMQMEDLGGKPVVHPVEVVASRLREDMSGRE